MKLLKLKACPWALSRGNVKYGLHSEMLTYCDFRTWVRHPSPPPLKPTIHNDRTGQIQYGFLYFMWFLELCKMKRVISNDVFLYNLSNCLASSKYIVLSTVYSTLTIKITCSIRKKFFCVRYL